jgi:hypothetical protein
MLYMTCVVFVMLQDSRTCMVILRFLLKIYSYDAKH